MEPPVNHNIAATPGNHDIWANKNIATPNPAPDISNKTGEFFKFPHEAMIAVPDKPPIPLQVPPTAVIPQLN
jgi:hypothetical protein